MKKIIFTAILIAAFCGISHAKNQMVIPQPAQYVINDGEFTVPAKWTVESELTDNQTVKLADLLKHPYSIDSNKGNLVLVKNPQLGDEAYTIEIKPDKVIVSASSDPGFFYAMQSLYQLSYLNSSLGNKIPCGLINDYPRFQHRGLMLDVARFFIPKDEVLKLIDIAAALKINTLHMHLTDDNGWRMEIKKYPKLTEVGAWRVERPEIFPGRKNQQNADEPTPVGGFYTQEDLKEIVAYAAQRHINVIPEIEMPAHAAAAIASYPELACPVVDKFVGVFPGIGGPDAAIIMCGGNDKVYQFYKDVLDEVMEVFPSRYIHLGGDEASKYYWEQCELCNQRIKDLGLNNFEELQAYFMDTINNYVRSKGRTAMGWDEVTYGDPKEDMVILGWQGDGGVAVRDAQKSGRKFIMTPATTLYLIRYQGPQWFEPVTYFGNNTLHDAYSYEPVKEDWSADLEKQLLGVQGSLWTEFCNDTQDVEYLVFPRLVGVADMAWRPKDSADWNSFIVALDDYLPELEERGINYAKSMYNIQHTAIPAGNSVEVSLDNERQDLDIFYSIGNPTGEKVQYTSPLQVKEPITLYANTYKDGKPVGKTLRLDMITNVATGSSVLTSGSRNRLDKVLTNGVRGSYKNSDFEWAGWYGTDAEFIIDLGESTPFTSGKLGTLGSSHLCVAMPQSVEMYGSDDGENYTLIATATTPPDIIFAKEPTKLDLDFGEFDAKARYVKFIARNPGKIPEGFPRAGNPSWIYFDEIILNP